MRLIIVLNPDDNGKLHLPNPTQGGSGAITLCGWVDAPATSTDGPGATCPDCCSLVRALREIPLSALLDERKK